MSFSPRDLRDALGTFSTGVCLVSVLDELGAAHAITVNSFASVSLDPPLVLWSLQRDSDVYAIFESAQQYCISILSEAQEELSVLYSQHDGHWMRDEDFYLGENGAPVLNEALGNFECQLERTYDGGDHLIILGRVTRVLRDEALAPLVFFSGQYRAIQ